MKWFIIMLGAVCVFMGTSLPADNNSVLKPETIPASLNFGIIFSGSLHGYIEVCWCRYKPEGGLSRRIAAIEDYIQANPGLPLLLIDSGNNFKKEDSRTDMFWNEAILKAMGSVGYQCYVPGPPEIGKTVKEFRALQEKTQIDFISANLMDAQNRKLLCEPFKVYEMEGVKIGVTGLTSTSMVKELNGQFVVETSTEALQNVLPQLEKYADRIVVATQLDMGDSVALIKSFPSIDIILGSYMNDSLPFYRQGKTILGYPGSFGQELGILKLLHFPHWKLEIEQSEMRLLSLDLRESDTVNQIVEETYLQINEACRRIAQKNSVPWKPGSYFGSVACKSCHEKEYVVWESSKHAKAFTILAEKKREYVPKCLKCHVTAYEEPGGFVDPVNSSAMVHVQCEACHHVDKNHIEGRITQKKTALRPANTGEDFCKTCHDRDNSPAFDYKNYLKKIAH